MEYILFQFGRGALVHMYFLNLKIIMCTGAPLLNSRRRSTIEVQKNYKVYMHTNLITGKKYVGITRLDVYTRWNNGSGYTLNKKFYSDIKKYGWSNFSHEILYNNLDYSEARKTENQLIEKYDLVNNGYNNTYSNLTDMSTFDYLDFATLDSKKYLYKNDLLYFTRIPNIFIRNNIHKTLGINRIFLIVFVLIDRNRSFEDKSYITIGQVLRHCGYKTFRNKPKVFYEIVKSILFLKENHFIETQFNYYSAGYEECIEINIIKENFDAREDFTKLYGKDFDIIMSLNTKVKKECVLQAFLYINSYIGCRPRNEDGSEAMYNPETKPEAFWRSIESMAKELSMSKDTITQCIDFLTTSTGDKKALLIKREVGSIQLDPQKPPKNVPNIYALNKNGYQQEIEWALRKMLEVYGVSNFDLLKGGNRNRK